MSRSPAGTTSSGFDRPSCDSETPLTPSASRSGLLDVDAERRDLVHHLPQVHTFAV
jgi:hypothetical protein